MLRFALTAAFMMAALGTSYAHTQPIIFFHGGNSNELDPVQWEITPEAEAVLRRVVEEFKFHKGRYLLVIGHDENASTEKLSQQRALNRALAAKGVLVRLGISEDTIGVLSCGYRRPYEARTGAEPTNRRVEFASAATLQELLSADRTACGDTAPR